MHSWSIDRLALTVPGYSERQARELSQLIAAAMLEFTGTLTRLSPGTAYTDVNLELTTREGEAMPDLARRIVAALAVSG